MAIETFLTEYGMVKSTKDIWYAIMHGEGHGPEGVIVDTQNEQTMSI